MLGVGTLYVLAFNGAMFGAIIALTYRAGFGNDLLELCRGPWRDRAVVHLYRRRRGTLDRHSAVDARRSFARRCAQIARHGSRAFDCRLRAVAGGRGNYRRLYFASANQPVIKIGIGVITGIALYSYLLLAGRDEFQVQMIV